MLIAEANLPPACLLLWTGIASDQKREGEKRTEIHIDCSNSSGAHSCVTRRSGNIYTSECKMFWTAIKNNNFVIYSTQRGIVFRSFVVLCSVEHPIKTFGCAHIQTLMDLEGPIYSEVWVLSAGA